MGTLKEVDLLFHWVVFLCLCTVWSPVDGKDLCADCLLNNGAGYNSHTDCNKFVHCQLDVFKRVVGTVQYCGFGTYWSSKDVNCVHSRLIDCPNDKCRTRKDGYKYKAEKNCRGYWKCQDKKSFPFCCKPGHRYSEGRGCVRSRWCRSKCLDKIEKPRKFFYCDKRPVRGNPFRYYRLVGRRRIRMKCPQGTAFQKDACLCKISRLKRKPECSPEVYLPFNLTDLDYSGSGNFIQNENVGIEDGYASFTGNGRLVIPRFNNMQYSAIDIHIEYEPTGSPPTTKPQAIMSNADCDLVPSIILAETATTIEFGARSGSKPVFISMPAKDKGRRKVVYRFSDGMLTGKSGNEVARKRVGPRLHRVKCALQIGHAENYAPFIGRVYEVKVYLCKYDGP